MKANADLEVKVTHP